MTDKERITELEIQLAHTARTTDELSDIVAQQAKRLEIAEKRIQMLMERAAEAEENSTNVSVLGDPRPPHW